MAFFNSESEAAYSTDVGSPHLTPFPKDGTLIDAIDGVVFPNGGIGGAKDSDVLIGGAGVAGTTGGGMRSDGPLFASAAIDESLGFFAGGPKDSALPCSPDRPKIESTANENASSLLSGPNPDIGK